MDFRNVDKLNRRDMIRGAAMLGAGATLIAPLPLWAQSGTMADIRKAAEAGKDASIKRIRDWIALPSIAAENRSMAEGAAYMARSEEHTSELQSLLRISYAVFCLQKTKQ